MKSLILLGILTIISSISCGVLENHGIYKIVNKYDDGVLTMSDPNSDSAKVYVRLDSDAATQKWRVKRPVLSKTYEFKPTSNEGAALTADKTSTHVHGMVTSSDGKYWHVRPVGESSFELKNYLTETCLTSQGINSTVVTSSCDNSKQQEWKLKQL